MRKTYHHLPITVRLEGSEHIGDARSVAGVALRADQLAVEQQAEVLLDRRGQGEGVACLIEAGEQAPREAECGVLIVEVIADDEVEARHSLRR